VPRATNTNRYVYLSCILSTMRRDGSMSSLWRVSPGQIRISVLQLCIFITLPQLALHACIATFVLRVLFHRSTRSSVPAASPGANRAANAEAAPLAGSRATLTQDGELGGAF
jgi:hypothetical protein